MGLFRRKTMEAEPKSRTVYKKTFKFKDGTELKMGTVRYGGDIPDAKRRPRSHYFDD